MKNASIITVSPGNLGKEGIFCLKNPKHPGYQRKVAWYRERYREGLRLKLLKDETGAMAGNSKTHEPKNSIGVSTNFRNSTSDPSACTAICPWVAVHSYP